MSSDGATAARGRRQLERIAEALGRPVSDFFGSAQDRLRMAELMGLWERLSSDDRDAMLREMRERLSRSGAVPELNVAADKDA